MPDWVNCPVKTALGLLIAAGAVAGASLPLVSCSEGRPTEAKPIHLRVSSNSTVDARHSDSESVLRLEMDATPNRAPLTLAGESRLGHWVPLPYNVRFCVPKTEVTADARLQLGVGTEVKGISISIGGAAPEALEPGWTNIVRAASAIDEGCIQVKIDGVPPQRVAFAQPLLLRNGARRPWVVLYMVDTLRFDQVLGTIGDLPIAPAFAHFAAEGIFFERAMGSSSWTRPTVATVLTGLEPTAHRIYGFADRLPSSVNRLPGVLAESGYFSVGLSSNPNILPEWGFFDGFHRFVDLDVRVGPERDRGFERLIEAAIAEVRSDSNRPLFLYVHDNGPHVPYQAPAPYREIFGAPAPGSPAENPASVENASVLRDSRLLYAAATRATDDRFAALMEALREVGRYEDALIILIGDHGEEFGEHGGLRHGQTLYQEQIHVPLVIKPPRGVAKSGTVGIAVSTADIAPTILTWLDIDPPDGMSSQRLPLPGESESKRKILISELNLAEYSAEVVIRWPWKYLRNREGRELLFDLDADPEESVDRSQHHPEIAAALKVALAERRRKAATGLGLTCVAGKRRSVVRVRLEALGGQMGPVEATGTEEEDNIGVVENEVSAVLTLLPPQAASSFEPEALARREPDRDGLRATDFLGQAIRVHLEVTPAMPRLRLVGPTGESLVQGREGVALAAITTEEPPGELTGLSNPVCQLYFVKNAGSDGQEKLIDPALEERLRELGYLE